MINCELFCIIKWTTRKENGCPILCCQSHWSYEKCKTKILQMVCVLTFIGEKQFFNGLFPTQNVSNITPILIYCM